MDAKNKHAALVADVALYEDRGERIKRLEVVERLATAQMDYIQQLETENDAMRADLLLWNEKESK